LAGGEVAHAAEQENVAVVDEVRAAGFALLGGDFGGFAEGGGGEVVGVEVAVVVAVDEEGFRGMGCESDRVFTAGLCLRQRGECGGRSLNEFDISGVQAEDRAAVRVQEKRAVTRGDDEGAEQIALRRFSAKRKLVGLGTKKLEAVPVLGEEFFFEREGNGEVEWMQWGNNVFEGAGGLERGWSGRGGDGESEGLAVIAGDEAACLVGVEKPMELRL